MAKTQKKTQKKSSGKLIKKPTSKGMVNSAMTVGGTLLGLLVANGVSGAIPQEYAMPVKVGMVAAGVAGSSAINSNSNLGKILTGVSAGIAIKGGYDLTTGVLTSGKTADPSAMGLEKFYQDAIGLGCAGGCDQVHIANNGLGNPFLIETVYDETTDMYSAGETTVSPYL